MYFDCHSVQDPKIKCSGKIKFHEINQDDDEEDFNGVITCESSLDLAGRAKKILSNELREQAFKTIQGLTKAMRERDSDEVKVKKDALEREQAKKAVEESKENTGQKKEEIFLEAKKKEEEMKKTEKEKAS